MVVNLHLSYFGFIFLSLCNIEFQKVLGFVMKENCNETEENMYVSPSFFHLSICGTWFLHFLTHYYIRCRIRRDLYLSHCPRNSLYSTLYRPDIL